MLDPAREERIETLGRRRRRHRRGGVRPRQRTAADPIAARIIAADREGDEIRAREAPPARRDHRLHARHVDRAAIGERLPLLLEAGQEAVQRDVAAVCPRAADGIIVLADAVRRGQRIDEIGAAREASGRIFRQWEERPELRLGVADIGIAVAERDDPIEARRRRGRRDRTRSEQHCRCRTKKDWPHAILRFTRSAPVGSRPH